MGIKEVRNNPVAGLQVVQHSRTAGVLALSICVTPEVANVLCLKCNLAPND